MPKVSQINKEYVSPLEFVIRMGVAPGFLTKIYMRFYPSEYFDLRNWSYGVTWRGQFGGAFQPWAYMAKDARDTFLSPYKAKVWRHAGWDALQPIRGLLNILKGIATFAISPLIFVACALAFAILKTTGTGAAETGKHMSWDTALTLSWMIEGVSDVVRGLTQIVTTPLTWLFKIPLRLAQTKIKGTEKVENSRGIQTLIGKAQGVIDGSQAYVNKVKHVINALLQLKYQKAQAQGQKTPQNLNIHSNEKNYFFRYHKIMGLLHPILKQGFSLRQYNSLPLDRKETLENELEKNVNSLEKQREIFIEYNLVETAKIFLFAHRCNGSTNRVLPKDLVRAFGEKYLPEAQAIRTAQKGLGR
jgi:hypothetical protein